MIWGIGFGGFGIFNIIFGSFFYGGGWLGWERDLGGSEGFVIFCLLGGLIKRVMGKGVKERW